MNYMTLLNSFPGRLTDKAPRTRELYVQAANRFARWLGEREPNQQLLDEYVADMQETSRGSGFRTKMLHVSAFVKYLSSNGYSLEMPPVPKSPDSLPKSVSLAEYNKLMGVTNHVHHALAWALMFRMGLRVGEVLALRWEDVDTEAKTLRIHRKGGKWQILPYKAGGHDIDKELTRLLETTPHIGEYLITSPQTGEVCSQQALWFAIKGACKRAKIKEISVHTLRHGFAMSCVKNNVNAFAVQTIMGHSSPTTTRLYLRSLGSDVETLGSALIQAGGENDG